MKKLLVVLLALTCLSALSFADGVTVGMDFGRTQFNVASSVTNGLLGFPTDIMQGWVGPTAQFPTGQRLDIQLAWSNDHTGINITGYLGNTAMAWVNAYGTLKFIPDLFTVYIGEFNGDGWDHFRLDSAHPIHDVNNNNVGRMSGWGAILDVMPKDTGFEAAVFMKMDDPTNAGSFGGGAIERLADQVNNYQFAASYTIPSLLKVAAGSTTFGLWTNAPGSTQRNIFASVQLFMVPNLTAWDNFYYAGFDVNPSVTIYSDYLALAYDMKPLTIILAASFGQNSAILPGPPASLDYGRVVNAGADYTMWSVAPEVIFNMGGLSLGLYVGLGGTSVANSGIGYQVEPYVKLNDFGTRISFMYSGSTAANSQSSWEIPVLIDWGF